MSTATYTVVGMSCGHCAASVSEEVSGLTGVTDVDVDLPTGRLTVTAAEPIEEARIRDAVAEAGYQLAGAS